MLGLRERGLVGGDGIDGAKKGQGLLDERPRRSLSLPALMVRMGERRNERNDEGQAIGTSNLQTNPANFCTAPPLGAGTAAHQRQGTSPIPPLLRAVGKEQAAMAKSKVQWANCTPRWPTSLPPQSLFTQDQDSSQTSCLPCRTTRRTTRPPRCTKTGSRSPGSSGTAPARGE